MTTALAGEREAGCVSIAACEAGSDAKAFTAAALRTATRILDVGVALVVRHLGASSEAAAVGAYDATAPLVAAAVPLVSTLLGVLLAVVLVAGRRTAPTRSSL